MFEDKKRQKIAGFMMKLTSEKLKVIITYKSP